MKTNYSHALRILICEHCGAPMEVALEGGAISCGYCNASYLMGERDESVDRAHAREAQAASISESERFAQLRRQDQGEEPLPESLRPWLANAQLDVAHLNDAEDDWRGLLTQLASEDEQPFALAERFFYLTILLAPHVEERKQRALLETASELLDDARHRHIVRCMLARLAAQNGDIAAADDWLKSCNPRPTDLVMDTAYRYARSIIATADNDPQAVFAALGAELDVPLADREQFACELLWLNALERSGEGARATDLLRERTDERGADHVMNALHAFAPLRVCEQSFENASLDTNRERLDHELETLAKRRRREHLSFFEAFASQLHRSPIYIGVLLVAISAVRCTTDRDPLLGVYGHTLCPRVCDECEGPTRTVTRWTSSAGSASTNGAEYFCVTPDNQVATMSDLELMRASYSLHRYKLASASVLGASYLIAFALFFPFLLFLALRAWTRSRDKRRELDAAIAKLAQERQAKAPPPRATNMSKIRRAFIIAALSLGLAAALMVLAI